MKLGVSVATFRYTQLIANHSKYSHGKNKNGKCGETIFPDKTTAR
jgi:hypothetical protein